MEEPQEGIGMLLRMLLALALLAAAVPATWAQGYPAKPVKVIVTFPPGGTPDIYGRIMSAELQKIWNQSVVLENRTGAGGTIGTDFAAKAAPDGYTLLFAADATITIAPHLYSKLPYDPVRDLAPIVNVAAGPFVLMANPAFPADNVKELIALVRAQPGRISYASSGAGGQQHLAMESIRTLAGNMDIIHVPYTRRHRPEARQGLARSARDRGNLARLRHHRLVWISRARGNAARDREENPRRRRHDHPAPGLPRAIGPRRHRAGREHARRIRRADQGRPRPMVEGRQGRRRETRLRTR